MKSIKRITIEDESINNIKYESKKIKSKTYFFKFFVFVFIISILGFIFLSQNKLFELFKGEKKHVNKNPVRQFKIVDNHKEMIAEKKNSRSLELAGYSMIELQNNPTLSFRLAEIALYISPNYLAKRNISILQDYPFHNIINFEKSPIINAWFSPDGNYIATQLLNKKIIIYENNTFIKQLDYCESLLFAKFSNDSKFLATGSSKGGINVWYLPTGKILHNLIKNENEDDIRNVVFTIDNKKIISISNNKNAVVWDLNSETKSFILENNNIVKKILITYDNKFIICVTEYGFSLWDNNTGEKIYTKNDSKLPITNFEISKDSNFAASISNDNTVIVYKLGIGEILYTLKDHNANVRHVSFSPNSGRIVTCSDDKTIRVYSAGSGEFQKILKGHEESVSFISFSNNNKYVVSASKDNTARVWDINTGRLIHILKGHEKNVNTAYFNKNNKNILTSSSDGTIRLWNIENNKYQNILRGHEFAVFTADFSYDNKLVVTGSGDFSARIWDAKTSKLIKILKGHEFGIYNALFSSDNEKIVTSSNDNTSILWDVKKGSPIHILKKQGLSVSDAVFSNNGKYILTICNQINTNDNKNNTAILWDSKTGNELINLSVENSNILKAVISHDDKIIATGSDDFSVRIWDISGDQIKILKGHSDKIVHLDFSSDNSKLISGSQDNSILIWDIKTGKKILDLKKKSIACQYAIFSPDNNYIAMYSNNDQGLYNSKTGELIYFFKGHDEKINNICFSPDSNRLASSSIDNTIIIWDCFSGKELYKYKGHKGNINQIKFSKDGNYIVSASSDKKAIIWQADYHPIIDRLNNENVNHLTKEQQIQFGITTNEWTDFHEKIIQKNSYNERSWVNLFLIHLNNHKKINNYFNKLNELLQTSPIFFKKIINSFLCMQKINEAKIFLKNCNNELIHNDYVNFGNGLIFEYLGETNNAVDSYLKILESSFFFNESIYRISYLYFNNKYLKEFKNTIHKINLCPKYIEKFILSANYYLYKGEIEPVKELYNYFSEKCLVIPEMLKNITDILAKHENVSNSKNIIDNFLSNIPNNMALYMLAKAFESRQKYNYAIDAYKMIPQNSSYYKMAESSLIELNKNNNYNIKKINSFENNLLTNKNNEDQVNFISLNNNKNIEKNNLIENSDSISSKSIISDIKNDEIKNGEIKNDEKNNMHKEVNTINSISISSNLTKNNEKDTVDLKNKDNTKEKNIISNSINSNLANTEKNYTSKNNTENNIISNINPDHYSNKNDIKILNRGLIKKNSMKQEIEFQPILKKEKKIIDRQLILEEKNNNQYSVESKLDVNENIPINDNKKEKFKKIITNNSLNNKQKKEILKGDEKKLSLDTKDYNSAEEVLKTLINIDKTNADLHIQLGLLYLKINRIDDSIKVLNYAIKLNDKNVEALNALGYVYVKAGKNFDKAEKLLKKALALKPDDGNIYDSYGWLLYSKGDYKKAIKYLSIAADLEPNSSDIYMHLGDAYKKLNNEIMAKNCYKKAYESEKTDN